VSQLSTAQGVSLRVSWVAAIRGTVILDARSLQSKKTVRYEIILIFRLHLKLPYQPILRYWLLTCGVESSENVDDWGGGGLAASLHFFLKQDTVAERSEVKNEWICTCTPPICLNDVDWGNLQLLSRKFRLRGFMFGIECRGVVGRSRFRW
jgi:hypothetical protein